MQTPETPWEYLHRTSKQAEAKKAARGGTGTQKGNMNPADEIKPSAIGTADAIPDASGTGMIEAAAPSGALSRATGSLPVSSAKALLERWRNMACSSLTSGSKRQAYWECYDDLRRELARANLRQPEENIPVSNAHTKTEKTL